MSDRNAEDPFHILVLADLSGRANAGAMATGRELAQRRVLRVDRDTFDDVLARLAPRLRVEVPGVGPAELRFRELTDFEPAALCGQVPAAKALQALRARLDDPRQFQDALPEARRLLGSVVEPGAPAAAPTPRPAAPPPVPAGGSLLEQILDTPLPASGSSDAWDAALLKSIEPELARVTVPGAAPGQAVWVAAADAALAAVLRGVLHAPAFQRLEAAWRSVFLLVRRLDLGSQLTLSLLDMSRDELAADVGVSGPATQSGLRHHLVEATVGTAGGQPWALVVADQAFGPEPRDIATLLRLTRFVREGGAALAAAATPALFGCRSLGATPDPEDWTAPVDQEALALWGRLRSVAEAASLALFWPRFLLRVPYGAASDPVDGMAFEECPGRDEHERLLWGNGAFALACALGEAFAEAGWDLRQAIGADLRDLPAWTHRVDGEASLYPCAEAQLTTTGAEAIAARGAIPLLSVRGSNQVRLGGLWSVAADGAELAGPWS